MRAMSVTTSARKVPTTSDANIRPPIRVRRLILVILRCDQDDKAFVSAPVEPIIRQPIVHLLHSATVPAKLTRIFSDVHFGDRASRVDRLAQLRPLLDGVDQLVLNGDTMDTRPGPRPQYTSACRAEWLE